MSMLYTSKLRQIVTVGLPIVSILLVGYMGSLLLNTSHAADTTTTTSIAAPLPAPVGLPTSVTSDCCYIKVNSAQISNDSSTIRLNTTLTNRTNHELQTSPGLQMLLVDSAGVQHSFTAATLAPNMTVGGPLAVGASRTEDLDFDLPIKTIPAFLQFQLDASTAPLAIGLPL